MDIVEVERLLNEVTAGFRDQTLNALAAFANLNPSIERLATVIHLAALAVTIREDDIAWTSYREDL